MEIPFAMEENEEERNECDSLVFTIQFFHEKLKAMDNLVGV